MTNKTNPLKTEEGQTKLAISETRYRRLFETAKDGILILDAETGMILDVNPFLIDLLGYSKEQFIEKAIWEIGFFKDIVANQENFMELQLREYIRYEDLPLETSDGRLIHVEFVSNVYLVDKKKVIQCNIRDITGRVRAERFQKLSNVILGILASNLDFKERSLDLINAIKEETKFSAVGIRLQTGDDYPYLVQSGFPKELIQSENSLTFKEPDGRICKNDDGTPLLACTCGLVISGNTDPGSPLFTDSGSFWTNDSSQLLSLPGQPDRRLQPRNTCIQHGFGSIAIIPIRINKKIVGVLQLNETKKGAFTKDIILFFEAICQIIGTAIMRKQTLDELFVAKEHAEESDRLKSAFLANMSHEIRTPMNGILGFAELLKEPGLTGEEQAKYIGIIEKSGARMLNIINDIVSISKIESGQMEVSYSKTDVNLQMEYIYTFFKPEADRKNIQFRLESSVTAADSIIFTDKEKVTAILVNLTNNALKFCDTGSIVFGCNVKENFFEFFVKDTGIGIPALRQKAVFDRFIQADISDARAYQGAGLGLSISKAYVEMLGGCISLDSEVGKGSLFTFTIPYMLHDQSPVLKKPEGLPLMEEAQPSKLNILIAEDDDTSGILISLAIRNLSKEIFRASTGAEAIVVCRNNPSIDVILMDMKMPVMDGYSATREIRRFNKTVVIIAQTAYGLSGDKEKALEAGCDGYIAKPYSNNALKTLLNECMKNRKQ